MKKNNKKFYSICIFIVSNLILFGFLSKIISEKILHISNNTSNINQLQKLANSGDSGAQFELGEAYWNGKNVKRDKEKAILLYEKSAKQGNEKSLEKIKKLPKNIYDKYKNIEHSLEDLNILAEKGECRAKFLIGKIFYEGRYAKNDNKKASNWFLETINENCIDEIHDNEYTKKLAGRYLVTMYYENKWQFINKDAFYQLVDQFANYKHTKNRKLELSKYTNYNKKEKIASSEAYIKENLIYSNALYDLGVMYYERKNEPFKNILRYYSDLELFKYVTNSYEAQVTSERNIKPTNIDHAFDRFNESSKLGNINAQFMIGKMYYEGESVNRNIEKGLKKITDSAQKGSNDAQYYLGVIYYEGKQIKKDYESSFKWLLLSAKNGNSHANVYLERILEKDQSVIINIIQKNDKKISELLNEVAELEIHPAEFILGLMYYNGQNVDKNLETAKNLFEKSAKHEYAPSQNYLGVMYFNGEGVQKNYDTAAYWWERASYNGDKFAKFNLGSLYFKNEKGDKNYEKVLKLWIESANSGHVSAMYNLGLLYNKGKIVPKDHQKAFEWLKQAAEAGSASAEHAIGNMYYYGNGFEKNENKAIEWYLKAAEKNHIESLKILSSKNYTDAQYTLATKYTKGEGVEKNFQHAVDLYFKAAQGGSHQALSELIKIDNPEAYYAIGNIYHSGKGFKQDEQKAFEWWTKAAESGHLDAQNILVMMLQEKENGTHEQHLAIEWWIKAADLGDINAQYNLGKAYINGDGIKKDIIKAYSYFLKAANQGHEESKLKAKEICFENPWLCN